MTVWRVWYPLD